MENEKIVTGNDIISLERSYPTYTTISNYMEDELKELSNRIDKSEEEVDHLIHSIRSLRIDVANGFRDTNDKIDDIDNKIKNVNSNLNRTKVLMQCMVEIHKNDIQALNESNKDILKKLRNIIIVLMILLFVIATGIILYFVI